MSAAAPALSLAPAKSADPNVSSCPSVSDLGRGLHHICQVNISLITSRLKSIMSAVCMPDLPHQTVPDTSARQASQSAAFRASATRQSAVGIIAF